MTGYIVLACPRCGTVRYAKEGQKTAKCLKCNYQIQLSAQKIKVLKKVDDVKEAIKIVKIYKFRGL